MENVATKLDNSALEAKADAEERLVVEASPIGSEDHTLDAASSEPTRYQYSAKRHDTRLSIAVSR